MSGGENKSKSTKIMIGIIAALAVVIIALVVILVVQGGKKKDKTTTEEKTTTEQATPADAATPVDATPSNEDADCYVTINNSAGWESASGYSGQLDAKITNESSKELNNWSIELDVPSGVTLDSSWNGNFEIKDNVLTITPVEYNGTIAANGSVGDIGFIVNASSEAQLKSMTEGARLYIDGQLYTSSGDSEAEDTTEETTEEKPVSSSTATESGTPFANHGKLAVSGTDLVDKNGNKYQLKGVSTHGIGWFPDYVNEDAFKTFRDDWDANVIRLAMYTHENGGYCTDGDKTYLKNLVDTGVQSATDLGMYVIVDWHVLQENNPQTYKEEAKAFFEEMSNKYKDYDNVIYEICNEPNGGTTWQDVKSYAEEIIPIIRNNAPDAVIIVGTPTWCQDVDVAAKDPITDYDNIMYAIHFYAATHTDNIRSKAREARDSGLPIIVSEFSICDASGNGAIDYNQAEQWFDLIDEYNLSYAAWNVSNKAETSSLIQSSCTKTSGWTVDDLSDTGKWIRLKMRGE